MLYALAMTDGAVSIMQTVGGATPEACLAKWPAAERAKVMSHQPIDPSTVPQDRAFRNAWVLAGDRISTDMPMARAILRDRLRAARAPQLEALDMAYMRADETKDDATKADVAKRKQVLRDVTAHPDIEAAETVDALKALTLDKLVGAAPPLRAKPTP